MDSTCSLGFGLSTSMYVYVRAYLDDARFLRWHVDSARSHFRRNNPNTTDTGR